MLKQIPNPDRGLLEVTKHFRVIGIEDLHVKGMNMSDRPKISVFIATSMDGYIAKKNNAIDWLTKFNPPTGDLLRDHC